MHWEMPRLRHWSRLDLWHVCCFWIGIKWIDKGWNDQHTQRQVSIGSLSDPTLETSACYHGDLSLINSFNVAKLCSVLLPHSLLWFNLNKLLSICKLVLQSFGKDSKFLVSKETVVLCLWESETWKFGFIKQFDKGRITTMKDLESWRFVS